MKILNEGDIVFIKGSGKKPYEVKKVGGVVSCSCPAWRNMGGKIDVRVCKHIKANIDPACMLPQQSGTASGVALVSKETKSEEPPILLAHNWEDEDPTGWWMSEKLDGVRAYWNGKDFISRNGNIYMAPEFFKEAMPKDIVLDGELFLGRKKFQQTISIVRKQIPDEEEWKQISYQVFDCPSQLGNFESRLEFLHELFEEDYLSDDPETLHWLYWEPLLQEVCTDVKHLKAYLREVEAKGGEGVMLRQPNSLYEAGRSRTLLKVKSFLDAEATVKEILPGKGKHKGRMGKIVVEMPNGTQFSIGTGFSDKQRENPPSIDSVVTYKYQELTDGGVPRFPVFITARDYE